jgi:hypothetical protein
MQTSAKIGCFAVAPGEVHLLAGTMGGEILSVAIDDFAILDRLRPHLGAIEAVAAHPRLPFWAAMGMDRQVSLIERGADGRLRLVDRFSFRDTPCRNDPVPVPPTQSLSQALTFHPYEPRLAVRSGASGVLEMEFGSGRLGVRHCTRFHGDIDLVTLRYVEDGAALLSAAGGHAVLSRDGVELRSWTLGDFNLHWFEPLGDEEYLVACDELYVIRLDLKGRRPPLRGHRLTRDDLEHVTFNPVSRRAFAAGFDGQVYEIDPATGDWRGHAWRAPYKMRWIRTLERAPDTLIAHCFNGGLYKVDLATGTTAAVLKNTPDTVWSSVRDGDSLWFAGEGAGVRRMTLGPADPVTGAVAITPDRLWTKPTPHQTSFAKRIDRATGPAGQAELLLAQKNGVLLALSDRGARTVIALDEELRDLAVMPGGSQALVCTEAGRVYRIDTHQGTIEAAYANQLREPIWSLAYHPGLGLVAFAERRGELVIAEADTLSPVMRWGRTSRPKRMKWCGDRLIHVQTGELLRFDPRSGRSEPYVAECGNTIEDFIWDAAQRYLVLVNYRTELVLCDFATGAKLSVVPDQADFSKGLAWLDRPGDPAAYPLEFITYGRSGTAHRFRIHNERLLALGPVAPALLRDMP